MSFEIESNDDFFRDDELLRDDEVDGWNGEYDVDDLDVI